MGRSRMKCASSLVRTAAIAFFTFFIVVAAGTAFAATPAAAATAALMDVTVGDLFLCRSAHFLHRDIEVEMLTRERMIPVNGNIIFLHFDDADRDRALIGAGLELHANFK